MMPRGTHRQNTDCNSDAFALRVLAVLVFGDSYVGKRIWLRRVILL